MPQLTYLEAIRQGIWEEMERDPSVFCIGEDRELGHLEPLDQLRCRRERPVVDLVVRSGRQ